MLSLSDTSYSVTVLGWLIIHLSPQELPTEPQSNQKYHCVDQICLSHLSHHFGKEGNNPLKTIKILSLFDLSFLVIIFG